MNDKHLPIEIQPPKWYLRRDNIQEEAIMSTGSALQAGTNIEGKALLGLSFCLGVGSHLVGSSRLSILRENTGWWSQSTALSTVSIYPEPLCGIRVGL